MPILWRMLAVNLVLPWAVLAAKQPPPFAWPALPDKATIEKAKAMPTHSGLVVLEHTCKTELRALGEKPSGVTRDEFVRLLIVNEAGVRNASFDVTGDQGATIGSLEGRTVSPDGTITNVDQTRDVKRLDISGRRRRDPIVSLATVSFPAPTPGAILDIHLATAVRGDVFYYSQPIADMTNPSLASELDLTIKSPVFEKVQWSAITFGDPKGVVRPEFRGGGLVHYAVASYDPGPPEPLSPPIWHCQPMVLAYLDFAGLRVAGGSAGSSFSVPSYVDVRGRAPAVMMPAPEVREFWLKYFQEENKKARDFIARPGSTPAAEPPAANADLETRVAHLYRHTQKSLSYNPDATKVDTLAKLNSNGIGDRSHGSLLLAYHLEQAKIPYKLMWVVNRRALGFTSIFRNEFLFGFECAAVVDVPGRGQVFMMPGFLDVPYGGLPEEHQEAVASSLLGETDFTWTTTPLNQPGLDSATYSYKLTLDAAGDATGTLELAKVGVPADDFVRWRRYREYRAVHPSKDEPKQTAKESQDELDDELAAQLKLPGDKLTLHSRRLESNVKTPGVPLRLTAQVQAKSLAEAAGDRHMLLVNPVLAGMVNQFTEERRTRAIWYPWNGKIVIDGTLVLPAGAAVVELPAPVRVDGPEGTQATLSVEKAESDGAPALHTHMEYDQPLVVSMMDYAAWRKFQVALAKMAMNRAVVTLPANKVIE